MRTERKRNKFSFMNVKTCQIWKNDSREEVFLRWSWYHLQTFSFVPSGNKRMQGRTYKWEHVYWGSRFVRYPPLNLISTDVKMTLIITELSQNSFWEPFQCTDERISVWRGRGRGNWYVSIVDRLQYSDTTITCYRIQIINLQIRYLIDEFTGLKIHNVASNKMSKRIGHDVSKNNLTHGLGSHRHLIKVTD